MTNESKNDPVQRINDLREKVLRGEDLTKGECKEAIQALRANALKSPERARKEAASRLPQDLKDLF